MEEVQSNVQQQNKESNKRAFTIYDLLNTIFLSLDSGTTDLSTKFGIPPIYSINNNELKSANQKIIIQQFFYGDKDGEWQFKNFEKPTTTMATGKL